MRSDGGVISDAPIALVRITFQDLFNMFSTVCYDVRQTESVMNIVFSLATRIRFAILVRDMKTGLGKPFWVPSPIVR
jgi:hypothetical protein